MAERERQDGVWVPAAWRGGHAAGDALRYYGEQVPIGQRVRQAHLEHFCPGGAGFPVTGSGPIGLGRVDGARSGGKVIRRVPPGSDAALAGSRLRQGRTPAGASPGLGCIRPARADHSFTFLGAW